ncbi:MAG: TetR family transcriptional regulator [Nocardioidaceae bacterium]
MGGMVETSGALRGVARQAVRDEVLRHAWRLFIDQGFEATTVEQVAEAAGMSRRTFFRYFANKDELILARLVEAGHRVAAALEARPPAESAWVALRYALDEVVLPQQDNAAVARRSQQLLETDASARSSMEERRRRWNLLLAPLIAARLGKPGDPPHAEALVGAAIACLDAAQQTWARTLDTNLGELLDTAMRAVAPLE